jgi:hypothetical protein
MSLGSHCGALGVLTESPALAHLRGFLRYGVAGETARAGLPPPSSRAPLRLERRSFGDALDQVGLVLAPSQESRYSD